MEALGRDKALDCKTLKKKQKTIRSDEATRTVNKSGRVLRAKNQGFFDGRNGETQAYNRKEEQY